MGTVYGSSYYTTVEGPRWTESEEQANKLGGHLVTINDAHENKFLTTTFGLKKWIGISDYLRSDEWRWASNEASNYNNWLKGYPQATRTHSHS